MKKYGKAIKLFEDFTGHDADEIERHEIETPKVGVKIGQCLGIIYETVRDGKREQYLHKFKRSARPVLACSENGRSLFLLGGNFEFTERGIVDD